MARIIAAQADAIPYPTQAPGEPSGQYQRIQATPESFGGLIGGAEQKFGAQAEQGGNSLFEAAMYQQNIYNEAVANQSYSDYQNQANKLLRGDPHDPNSRGFMNLTGQAALDARESTQDTLEALRQKIRGQLPSVVAQNHFDNDSRRLQSNLYEQIGVHYDQQLKVYGVSSANSGLLSNERMAATNFGDDSNFRNILADQESIARQRATLTGESPDGAVAETKSKLIASRIDGALSQGNYDWANNVFQNYGSNLDPATRLSIGQHLNNHLDKAALKAQATAIETGGTLPSAQGGGAAAGANGDLWSRIKGAEGGVGAGGESLVSPKGAIGVSQILPQTAQGVAAQLGVPYDEQRLHTDTAYNETLGKQYLDNQLTKYNGNEALASAAYNAGPGRVDSWLQTIGDPRTGQISNADFARQIPIPETRAYVQKILGGSSQGGAASPSFGLATGDSIAVQQIRRGVGGAEGRRGGDQTAATAVVGDSPAQVSARVAALPADQVNGKSVFLSTGVSNDPSQISMVAGQIATLKSNGASSVVVPGVGPGVPDSQAVNAQLKTIVEQSGGVFFQPDVKWAADGIHPTEVDKVRQQGQAALSASNNADQINQPAAPANSAQQMPPGFPSFEQWAGKIPYDTSDPKYDALYSELRKDYSHLVQTTSAERAQTKAQVNGGIAMLSDGRDFSWDEGKIRGLFTKDKADEMIGQLQDAQTMGQQIVGLRGMSPDQISQQIQANQTVLNNSSGDGYVKQAALSKKFLEAAQYQDQQLKADPATYLLRGNPEIKAAWGAIHDQTPEQAAAIRAAGQPDALESYASKMLEEQERMGVPDSSRQVLTKTEAGQMASKIMSDPQNSPATLKSLAQQWGTAWPEVWRDVSTVGKLPVAYQMVGALDNEADGALLARALAHSDKEGISKSLETLVNKGISGIEAPTTIIKQQVDNATIQYAHSLALSGASAPQIEAVIGSIQTLAQAKVLYNEMKSDADAAKSAIDSAIGKWAFLPNGGARIPTENQDAIESAAHDRVQGLDLNGLVAPKVYGTAAAPGSATADDWLRVLKANPNWTTVGNSIRLMDGGGRFVRNRDGSFIDVPFNVTAPVGQIPASQPGMSNAL